MPKQATRQKSTSFPSAENWRVITRARCSLITFAHHEIIATSDAPAGVFNVLAGDRAELASHFASHMDVNAIVDSSGNEKIGSQLHMKAGLAFGWLVNGLM